MAQIPFKGIHHKDGIVPGREGRVTWSDQLKAHVAEGPKQCTCERREQIRKLKLNTTVPPDFCGVFSTKEWMWGECVMQVLG